MPLASRSYTSSDRVVDAIVKAVVNHADGLRLQVDYVQLDQLSELTELRLQQKGLRTYDLLSSESPQ